MSKPLLVGLTGGIGAGKSIVARVFKILGVPVYDADTRAKELMVESESLRSAITVLFGDDSFEDGQLNRKHIASKAFYDPKLLTQLNGLVHPAVAADFDQWIKNHSAEKYLIKEAALLFETGSAAALDKVILVSAEESVRMTRVKGRDDHRSEEDIKAIMKRQMSDSEKEAKADVILKNDGSEMLLPEILSLHDALSR